MVDKIHDVVVVGTGFAGLAAAHWLAEAGIHDVTLIERSNQVGGTWRDNTYPGAACDVPSHLYSLSFAPNPDWSHSFSRQAEIQDYLVSVADKFNITPKICFDTELTEATWHEDSCTWLLAIATTDGVSTLRCRHFISAAGALSDPAIPDVPGLADFDGEVFHSARWRHDLDLRGRRVAVVGTGASAIQFVPEIQPFVDQLTLFQRTAPWVVPRRDRSISGLEKRLYRSAPWTQNVARSSIYLGRESTVGTFLNPKFSKVTQRLALHHLHKQVQDPTLRETLTPNYTIGCKRILISNSYYPALTQPNVTVIGEGVTGVDGTNMQTTSGTFGDFDTIILGTGFQVQNPPIAERIYGTDGVKLRDFAMASGGALSGTTLHNFPNFYMVPGPNTGLGHTSQVVMIEAQVRHMAGLLQAARRTGAKRICATEPAQSNWVANVEERMDGTVWTTGGCSSWYLDAEGRNSTLWPGSTVTFRRKLANPKLDEYELR